MGYAFIPVVVSIVLVVQHLAITEEPRRSKLTVLGIVAASLAIWRYWPQWTVVAMLLQVGISIYMLMYLRWNTDAA